MMTNSNIMDQSKMRRQSISKSYLTPADESTLWEIRMKLTERIKDAVKLGKSS